MASRGWERATEADVRDRRAPKKASKYRNVKVVIDGIVFDSKREAARYQELVVLLKAGHIRALCCQMPFRLLAPVYFHGVPHGDFVSVAEYLADFTYEERVGTEWKEVVEDVKGVRGAIYRLKSKWMFLQYGIQIRET